MITIRHNSRRIFLIVIVTVIVTTSYATIDYLINYKTWGDNKKYFLDDYYSWKVTCDVNYFDKPSNCKVIDDNGQIVPNDDIIAQNDICYATDKTGRVLPCILP